MSAAQPIPLLYSGQVGDYFGTEYEGLPAHVHPSINDVGVQLTHRDLIYLGVLTCSEFSQVQIYAYATSDRQTVVSVMAGVSGLCGIDCVCKFEDGSFLTTTTTQIAHNAYDEQRLFRISFPELNAVELLEQHQSFVQEFEDRCGGVQAIFTDLLSLAQMVDEYTLRQRSNPGHGVLQFTTSVAQAGVAQMIMDDSNDEDLDEDDDDNVDRIEYDEVSASPLIQAILQDDLDQIETLLAQGAELDPKDWQEEVPLVAAVYRQNPEVIQRLIAAGANLDRLDLAVDCSPVGMAIKQNCPDLVTLLLKAGASPDSGDLSWTGLTLAINQDNLPILKILLEAGADPNADMEDYDRAIMHAAYQGNLEMVQLLVAHGADVNAWSQGDTAIMSAAHNEHKAVYEYLYSLVDEETRSYADKHGQKVMAKAAKRKARLSNKRAEKLGDAALYGKLAQVKQLLEEGIDPNAITECGKSPLMLAAMYGHKVVMAALLDAGADPNLGSDEEYSEGTTALMYIASSFFATNRVEVIQLLVERGANVNAKNDKGQTALMVAGENVDVVKALIEAGTDVDLRDNEGNTAMMLGSWAVQQLLKQAGASEEGLNDIALVNAARKGDLSTIEVLLQEGANVNYGDGSALVAATSSGHLAIVERLIKAGADVNLGWRTGFTPIADAAYSGNLEIVERLLSAGANPFQKTHDEEFHDALGYAELGQAEGHHRDKDYGAIIERLKR